MAYLYSAVDLKNRTWMESDTSCATLRAISSVRGSMRGLGRFNILFEYPIAAIAGGNGSGKSTLLAIAACGFHNKENGYNLDDRKNSYYTFSDFFIQAVGENAPEGIMIRYQIRYNNWKASPPGLGWQSREKLKKGKRWNNYRSRVKRNVLYFGIHRIVPVSENSAHRSYRRYFKPGVIDNKTKARICGIASRIFGKCYDGFDIYKHSRYSLIRLNSLGVEYSSFNMGAGESAIFQMLVSIFQAGKGALIIIDEIELGLHEKAQKGFIAELKDLCNELHCQVICSTHSPFILNVLPPEGRFFIESTTNGETNVVRGISPEHAKGILADSNSEELDVFVEDFVASSILMHSTPIDIRSRISIHIVGSSESLIRALATYYKLGKAKCIAIIDGDKKTEMSSLVSKCCGYIECDTSRERVSVKEWIKERLSFLPGTIWPEKWLLMSLASIVDANQETCNSLKSRWGLGEKFSLTSCLNKAIKAGKHKEFHVLSQQLHSEKDLILSEVVKTIDLNDRDAFAYIREKISNLLR